MQQPSFLRFGHHFSVDFRLKVSPGSQLLNIWRSHAHPQLSRAFSSSPTSQRFQLGLKKARRPKMAPEVTNLKGQLLDRTAVESLLKRRFFYAPTADIYG